MFKFIKRHQYMSCVLEVITVIFVFEHFFSPVNLFKFYPVDFVRFP